MREERTMNAYIDSRFKWAFIVRFCIGMVIISILSSILIFLTIPKKDAAFYSPLIYTLHQAEADLVPIILIVGLFEIVLAFLFTLLLALFLSHKVGGPIYKLERNIEKLKAGDCIIPGISFRNADQGQILAAKFNEMLKNWHTHFKKLNYSYCKFSSRINTLERDWPQAEKSSLENSRMITRIKNDVVKMQEVLDRFII
jgi:HAMP domain-containing protein